MRNDEAGPAKAGPDTASPAVESTGLMHSGAQMSAGRVTAADHESITDRVYTYAEVVHALALAYVTGRTHADVGLAETQHHWAVHASPRRTYEQRVADRVAEMERCAADLDRKWLEKYGWPRWRYPGGPVDWETSRPTMNGVAA